MASLPPFTFDGWRLQPERRAKTTQQLKDFTTSSLARAILEYQLDKHFATPKPSASAPSLTSLTMGKILEELPKSPDLTENVRTVAESLDFPTLRQLLDDRRTPYQLLRTFLALPQTVAKGNRKIVDVDEAVLRNERYIRSRDSNQDGKYLVPLEDLSKMLSETPRDDGLISFRRKDPPKGGLEILDTLRKRELAIQPNSSSFAEAFERITDGALRGLDWSNVIVAGGIVLTTLLHTDRSKDGEKEVMDPDIDLYIYGLGAEDANRKVEEIHDAWVRHLPPSGLADRLVVKSAKTINLISDYPIRRVRIILELLPSPIDVLLKFDLDACAICFDGSRVLMLPRCARAIETGYSVFTMDLIWGHHLSERRASQQVRIFKYANRGFGLRILPSYVRSLEEDNLEAAVFQKSRSPASAGNRNHDEDDDDEDDKTLPWSPLDRKPCGKEPGLKSLKRIAYLGQDFLHRYYFGATSLAISQQQYHRQRILADPNKTGTEHVINQELENEWNELFARTVGTRKANERRKAVGDPSERTSMSLAALDSSGASNFEVFMRYCEAWRLHALGEAKLYGRATSIAYDPATYDDIPDYVWNETFTVDHLEGLIESHNNKLWENVRTAICDKLGIPFSPTGCESHFFILEDHNLIFAPNVLYMIDCNHFSTRKDPTQWHLGSLGTVPRMKEAFKLMIVSVNAA